MGCIENGFSFDSDHFGMCQLLSVLLQPARTRIGRATSAHRVKELRMARCPLGNGRDRAREINDLRVGSELRVPLP